MPGPRKKYSPAERAAQGNPGNRPGDVKEPHQALDDFFPEAPETIPPPPAFLRKEVDPDGPPHAAEIRSKSLEIWNYLAAYVHEARLLRDGDGASLGRLCRYLAEWDHLTAILDAESFMVRGGQGLQRHPALLARNVLEGLITKLEAQFGLNPNDRLKLTKDFANSLKNLPLAGKTQDGNTDKQGPVGFLAKPKEPKT